MSTLTLFKPIPRSNLTMMEWLRIAVDIAALLSITIVIAGMS